jgi:3'-phosphoadenosine 5'-phosphosulfate sulfotransferase
MNYRNAYFDQRIESVQLAIDYATEKKSPGWEFKVQCLEELKGEYDDETISGI